MRIFSSSRFRPTLVSEAKTNSTISILTEDFSAMDMWDQRFKETPYFYGKMPNDFVVSSVGYIPKGEVLCLAEGEGRNSVFLARSGYKVTGVDFSEQALANARKLAQDNKVEVEYQQADLSEYAIGKNRWAGIVSIFCHLPKALRQRIHRNVVEGLQSGGVFVIEAYAPKQLQHGTGGPKDLDLLMALDDIKQELEGLDFVVAEETERIIFEGVGHNGPSAVTQVVAIKP